MKKLIFASLATAALAVGAQAQTTDQVEDTAVDQTTVPATDRAVEPGVNPDMDEQPVVEQGLPTMDAPGMDDVDQEVITKGEFDDTDTYSVPSENIDPTTQPEDPIVEPQENVDVLVPDTGEDTDMMDDDLMDESSDAIDEVEGGLENAGEEIHEETTEGLNEVEGGLEQGGEELYDETTEGVDEVEEGLEDAGEETLEAGEGVMNKVENGTEKAVDATGDALNKTGNAIDNTFDSVTGGDEEEEEPTMEEKMDNDTTTADPDGDGGN